MIFQTVVIFKIYTARQVGEIGPTTKSDDWTFKNMLANQKHIALIFAKHTHTHTRTRKPNCAKCKILQLTNFKKLGGNKLIFLNNLQKYVFAK